MADQPFKKFEYSASNAADRPAVNPMRPRRPEIATGAPPSDKFQQRRERQAGQSNSVTVQRFRCGDEQKCASSGGNVHNLLLRIFGALDVVDAAPRMIARSNARRTPALAEMRQPEAQPAFQRTGPTARVSAANGLRLKNE